MSALEGKRGPHRVVLWGMAAAGVLVMAGGASASAHVHVDPGTAPAGQTVPVTFSFEHGCDGSPTVSLTVSIPSGVGNATPQVQGGWSIHRDLRPDGTPSRVTYTADTPIQSGLAASVGMNVLFDSTPRASRVAFPVLQTCASGATSWVQIPRLGQDPESLSTPAPVVTVTPSVAASAATDGAAEKLGGAWAAGVAGLAAGVVAIAVSGIALARTRRPR